MENVATRHFLSLFFNVPESLERSTIIIILMVLIVDSPNAELLAFGSNGFPMDFGPKTIGSNGFSMVFGHQNHW